MFAFAIWDERRRTLMLARDRLGKKPLYYSLNQSRLLFGSELKALVRSGELEAKPDLESLHRFLMWQCIPSPRTAFCDVRKLPPASRLIWRQGQDVQIEQYWKLSYADPLSASEAEIAERVRDLTVETTRVRLMADVPVGLFLSGGIDSACVLAAARQTHTGRIRTFSVSFGEQQFDESKYARLLAKHFATEHHEFHASPKIVDLLPRMAELFDEPFADPSAIPTYYLARLTREHVKVALSGDGGDEAFGGYQRYLAMKMLRRVERVPGARHLVKLSPFLPYSTARRSKTRYLRELLPLVGRAPEQQYKAMFLGMMGADRWRELYTPDFRAALNGSSGDDFIQWNGHGEADDLSCAMASDTLRYIPECLNVKVDMSSMACALEVRSPFLDYRLVEFSARIPSSMKIKGRTQKAILKRAFEQQLPKEILEREKSGFTVPLSSWLRRELHDFARSALLSPSSAIAGVVSREQIALMLDQHGAGKRNWHVQLWRLLVLENWLQATSVHSWATSASA
jgi:asparagine synthase (glutamine-hydrolysing)